ncbi:MAG: hypothetical protein JNM90_22240 [Burkholderiales bacterium]|nr:hypothetical protein [Burkholderiales bacterium]
MTIRGAEKAMQLASIPGIWLAFVSVWLATPVHVAMHQEQRAGCSTFSSLWFAIGGSGAAFLVPAALTAALAWLMMTRNPHATLAAGGTLCVGLLYSTGASLAAILPMYSLCRGVV